MRKITKGLLALLLCFALICPLLGSNANAEEYSVVDKAELEALMEDYLASHDVNGGNMSIGFCYTATGERWYYNDDCWYYAGSMYKVPLMMLMAEKVKSGEITEDTEIQGMSLKEAQDLILIKSNNEWAHVMRRYLGGDAVWREESKKYSSMKDEDYNPDFIQYGYVNPVYVVDVFNTLYQNPDDYPGVLEDLLQASPGEYLRRNLEGQYEIAQKYGALEEFYHVGGIIYTPNPIIVTVMTKFSFSIDELMGDAASMLVDYSLKLDERLEKLKAEPEVTATPEVQPVETPAPAETPAVVEPEIEEKGDGKTADTLVKLAAYISLPCFALAVILGLMQAAANARRKANRKRARARAEAQARSRSRTQARRR